MNTRFKLVLIGILTIVAVAYVRLLSLNAKPLDPQAFSRRELAEVYLLGFFMAAAGYPLSPEAASEHFGLMSARTPKTKVNLSSAFIWQSRVVMAARRRACRDRSRVKLKWPMTAYAIQLSRQAYVEMRVSLALNGGEVDCRDGIAVIRITVDYPPKALATFLRIRRIPVLQVQEGLFHVLEVREWYTPYVAEYHQPR